MNVLFGAASPILPPASSVDPALLAAPANTGQNHKIEEVAKSFESLFVSQLVKEMRQTLEPTSFFAQDSGDVWGGMFDLYLGQHLAQANALGIADMVKKQLLAQQPPTTGGGAGGKAPAPVEAGGGPSTGGKRS